jgi:hypothetical protein
MANTSTRRTVSRPGVSTEGASAFYSPFQPPPAGLDFDGDAAILGVGEHINVLVGGKMWRLKVPDTLALKLITDIHDAPGGQQIQLINAFLQRQLHPVDFQQVLRRLLNPDDTFTTDEYMELYRRAVTVGTARPFRRSSGSREQRRSHGERSARSSR